MKRLVKVLAHVNIVRPAPSIVKENQTENVNPKDLNVMNILEIKCRNIDYVELSRITRMVY